MKKAIILVFTGFLMFALTNVRASDYDYTKVDLHARQAPEKLRYDLDKLTKYLSKPAKNDREKIRAFYTWIADNIAYDVQLFKNYRPSRYTPISPVEVLKRRKAVCQGYAELFQEMCRREQITCYVIGGYSKGFGYTPKATFATADHAWNVLMIDGQWHLIDVTWGSGGIDEKMKFVKTFNEDYFLSDPKVFVRNHLPLAPMWQLLDCPVPIKVYAQGDEYIKRYLQENQTSCYDFKSKIATFENKSESEQNFYAAELAFEFNPENPVVLARAYMDKANELMRGIPRKLTSREQMLQAMKTQEEALSYLKKADSLVEKAKTGTADQEKQLIANNIKTSEQNLKGLKNALK